MTSSRKKIVDHTMLSGSVLKIAGRVTKTSEGPAVGSMPTLKTAGKITTPRPTPPRACHEGDLQGGVRDVGVVLEIGGIGHQAAQTDRQREEGLSERGEHRRGRHLREVGSEEEFHAFGAARQQDGVDGQHHEDQQQQRHHDASRAFDPFLDAQCDDAVRQQGEDDGVEQRFPRVLREGVEERFVGFGGTDACEFARERVDHVFQRPARDHQIEAHDEQRSQNTVVARIDQRLERVR